MVWKLLRNFMDRKDRFFSDFIWRSPGCYRIGPTFSRTFLRKLFDSSNNWNLVCFVGCEEKMKANNFFSGSEDFSSKINEFNQYWTVEEKILIFKFYLPQQNVVPYKMFHGVCSFDQKNGKVAEKFPFCGKTTLIVLNHYSAARETILVFTVNSPH